MRRSKRSWREPLGVAFVLILSLTMGFAGELMALNLDQEVLNAEDLDALILNHESQLQGLRRGTEKSILWYDENQKEKTPWSIVYLHGFSASRREISPVVETLAKNLKANVFFTRFTGHGLTGAELGRAKFEDWQKDAIEAYTIGKRIGDRTLILGLSTGATMAIWLASQLGDSLHSVDALVVGSPNFGPADERSEIFLLPFGLGTFIVKNFIANHYGFTPVNSSHSYYWTTYYPVEGIREVMKAVRAVREIELENLSTPLLMLYTRHDQVLSLDKMLQGFARIGSPVKILYEVKGSVDHGLAGDILSPESNREVIDVIELFVRGL